MLLKGKKCLNLTIMNNLIISIIICTYNREKFLLDCLQSLIDQQASRLLYEIVIVNNNSTDSTKIICTEFVSNNPDYQIKYFEEIKQGLSFARNRGIKESKGKYVSFIDDDAIAFPDFISNAVNFISSFPKALAFGGKVIAKYEMAKPVWENPISKRMITGHYDLGESLFRYKNSRKYPVGSNMFIKRSYFQSNKAFDPDFGRTNIDLNAGEEKELFVRIYSQGYSVYYTPDIRVFHQVDAFRLETGYIKRLSYGVGRSQAMIIKDSIMAERLVSLGIQISKFIFSIGIAFGYLFLLKPATFIHIIKHRYWVLFAYFQVINSR